MSATSNPPARRRRGEELESAILGAAWAELLAVGYARLTMASVATRAGTSEPVLYRRWPNKDGLVVAALQHHRAAHPIPEADTGSLRGDLIGQLSAASAILGDFLAITVGAALAGLLADTGSTPSQVRAHIMGEAPNRRPRALYRRAHARGEIDLDRTPAAVLEMPFELLRHDLLMTLTPPPSGRIVTIVDELTMPLLGLHRPAS